MTLSPTRSADPGTWRYITWLRSSMVRQRMGVSCDTNPPPCGAQLWSEMTWGVTKLHAGTDGLHKVWTALSSWKPAPDNGSGWEPVFHPALHGRFVYAPGDAGSLMRFDRRSGMLVDRLQPFDDDDPTRYVVSPVTVDADGTVYYTVLKLDAAQPWSADSEEGWLVKFDSGNQASKISFRTHSPGAE
jgi:hypothetical protein